MRSARTSVLPFCAASVATWRGSNAPVSGPWARRRHGAARPRTLGGAQPALTLVPAYQANSSSGGALAGAIVVGELGSSR
jgi:hypothetical protein